MKKHALLAAWLPTARSIEVVELLTVTKLSGVVWRFASTVDSVVDGTTVYLGSGNSGGLLWSRQKLTFKQGIELSECVLTIQARPADRINALTVAAALRARIWDDATLLLSRAYFDETGLLRGVLPRYQGQTAPMQMKDGNIELTLKPPSQMLNRAVPPVYQAACRNTLFDAGCGVNRAAYTGSSSVQAGSTTALVQAVDYHAPIGQLPGGVLTFTSGTLNGIARTIRGQSGDPVALSFFQPFPTAPAAGDTFTLSPGCDRSLGAGGCAKFSNRLRFRGTPFIPLPETAL